MDKKDKLRGRVGLSYLSFVSLRQERARVQTLRWAEGAPFHNRVDNECCPDFSCCQPELFDADDAARWATYHERYGGRQ